MKFAVLSDYMTYSLRQSQRLAIFVPFLESAGVDVYRKQANSNV